MHDLSETLEKNGISAKGLDRIRLAQGVVGKSSYVAGAALLVLAAAAVGLKNDYLTGAVIVAAVIIFIVYFAGVLWFATKNPGVAMLEGAELIKWRQMDIGMKGVAELPNSPSAKPGLLVSHDAKVGQ